MNAVKELRNAAGMSQRKFASYLGIPVANIQNWEKEIHNPPAYVITLITRVMKNDGFLGNELTPRQIDAIRQTKATLAIENLEINDITVMDLQKMVRGEISREDIQKDLKLKYKNHELY